MQQRGRGGVGLLVVVIAIVLLPVATNWKTAEESLPLLQGVVVQEAPACDVHRRGPGFVRLDALDLGRRGLDRDARDLVDDDAGPDRAQRGKSRQDRHAAAIASSACRRTAPRPEDGGRAHRTQQPPVRPTRARSRLTVQVDAVKLSPESGFRVAPAGPAR